MIKIKRKINLILMAGIVPVALTVACKKDDKKPEDNNHDHEHELITSMILEIIETANPANKQSFAFRDPDGIGGSAPTEHDTILLESGKNYTVTVELLDESKSPADNITAEVQEEDDEHIFCFTPSGVDVSITRTDSDGKYGVGINSAWVAGSAGQGLVKVALKHQPGVKDGTCDPGETDVEVDFVTVVK